MDQKRKKMLLSYLRVAALVYAGLCLLLYVCQRRLVYFPSRGQWGTPRDLGMAYEDVRITTEDGVRLHGWFVPAQASKGTILFFHGNAGNVSHRIDSIRIFRSLGYHTLIFDYRGYGQSEGKPSEEGTYRDAEAARRYLVEQRGVAPEKIVLFGRSLGGPIAAWLAKEHAPGTLILESTFTSLNDMAARLYWFVPVRLLSRFKYNTLAYAKQARCPILVIHSPEDDIVPYRFGRRLYEESSEPKEFLQIQGNHNTGFQIAGEAYVRGLREFFDKHVGRVSASDGQ